MYHQQAVIAFHIPDTKEDASLAAVNLIKHLQSRTDITHITVIFSKGRYDFYPDSAFTREYYISNHDQHNPQKGCFRVVTLPESRYVVYGSNIGPAIIENSGWKLRHYAPKNVFELYNLNTDPQERNNIIDKYPQIAERLKTILINECDGNLGNGMNRAA
ncbi:MAG: hypothetical protein Q4G63_03995 [Bacteroidia bacterium]|nr:hypothetical protein [Bacteroidia bacterium]